MTKAGALIASHTDYPYAETDNDMPPGPIRTGFDLRLKKLKISADGYYAADAPLTPGIIKNVSFDAGNSRRVSYDGPLWELDVVEVVARNVPPYTTAPALGAPEMAIFNDPTVGVSLAEMQEFLRANNLALIINRNVTHRDDADKQQPFNLRVRGTSMQTIGAPGERVYEVTDLQIFQGDHIRGYKEDGHHRGRAAVTRVLNDLRAMFTNKPNPAGPQGGMKIASDGSIAAFVPARRALTWQLVNGPVWPGNEIVQERMWLTFQPGEIRLCIGCHGVNNRNQAGGGIPTNSPAALRELLIHWRATH